MRFSRVWWMLRLSNEINQLFYIYAVTCIHACDGCQCMTLAAYLFDGLSFINYGSVHFLFDLIRSEAIRSNSVLHTHYAPSICHPSFIWNRIANSKCNIHPLMMTMTTTTTATTTENGFWSYLFIMKRFSRPFNAVDWKSHWNWIQKKKQAAAKKKKQQQRRCRTIELAIINCGRFQLKPYNMYSNTYGLKCPAHEFICTMRRCCCEKKTSGHRCIPPYCCEKLAFQVKMPR